MTKEISELNSGNVSFNVEDMPLQIRFTRGVEKSKVSELAASNFRVARALALIESEYAVPQLDLNLVSRRLSVTKPHLCRIFKREIGIGLPEYVRRMRAQKAEELLRKTVLSIKEITAAVGFVYGTQLDRAFKAAYGCSPKEYRSRAGSQALVDLGTTS